MEIFGDIFGQAFGPNDMRIFILAALCIGFVSWKLSGLWIAVLFAIALDIMLPGMFKMLDGASLAFAQAETMQRISSEGGSGILLRGVGYFAVIPMIILIKKGLAEV